MSRLLIPLVLAAAAWSAACSAASEPTAPAERPPVLLQFYGPPGTVSPGDTVTFDFIVRDSVLGEKYLTLRFDGAFSDVYTFVVTTTEVVAAYYIRIRLPSRAEPLRTALATLIVTNEAGLSHHRTFSMPILDLRPPVAAVSLGGLRSDGTIGTGQPLNIHVIAGDNHRLQYIGYAGGGLRDSVPATSTGDSHTFRITVPAHWTEPRPIIRAWARDASSLASVDSEHSRREAPVYDWRNHPVATALLTSEPWLKGVLWDSTRSVLYVMRGSRIEVVQPTGALETPIILPGPGSGFTFTASGDSLLVTLPGQRALGVIDLQSTARTTTLVPLLYDDDAGTPRLPETVAVSGPHVFVTLITNGLHPSRLVDINLANGTQVIRDDFTTSHIDGQPGLFRLPDGRVYLGPQVRIAEPRFVYSPGTDRFARTHQLRAAAQSAFSASPSGRFMLGNTVFDAALNTYVVVERQDWKESSSWIPTGALSPDGNSVFLATHYGIARFNLNSLYPVAQIKLDVQPLFMVATPDGSKLIAVGGVYNTATVAVKIVDLTTEYGSRP